MTIGNLSNIRNYGADPEACYLTPNLVAREEYDISKASYSNIIFQNKILIGSFKNYDSDTIHFDTGHPKNNLYYDSYSSISEFIRSLESKKTYLLISHLAFEAAANPLKLACAIKEFLAKSIESKLLFITNEKAPDFSVYRKWNNNQAITFFKNLGFKIEVCTLGFLLSYNEAEDAIIAKELFGFDIDPNKIKTLIVTQEYSPASQTGGIGTFFNNRFLLNPDETLIVYLTKSDSATKLKIITAELFFTDSERAIYNDADIALYIAQILSAYFTELKFIHYHDYNGIGYRIAQAARYSELPSRIETIVSLNGNHPYVEFASGVWSFFIDELQIAQEKIATELADYVIAPTNFIANLTLESGFKIANDKLQILRHPFSYEPLKNKPRKNITKLIFFGKRVRMKGYPDFLSVAKKIIESNNCIEEVILLGPTSDLCNIELEQLKELVKVTECSLPRDLVQNYLHEIANEALILFPNPAENFGNVILEAISTETPFICYLNGGLSETLIPEFHKDFASLPNIEDMFNQALKLIEMDPYLLAEKIKELKLANLKLQSLVNDSWRNLSNNLVSKKDSSITFNSEEVTLMIPVYETNLKYVSELFINLNKLVFKPHEIIIVDDCSSLNYHKKLQELAINILNIPFKVIQLNKNVGVAAARNAALAVCTTEYLANIDSDDIPCPNFILDLYTAIKLNPHAAASLGFYSKIDVDAELSAKNISGSFDAYGDGVVANLRINKLGSAMGLFKTDIVRALGGWTGDTKEIGDDFRLFVKIISENYQIAIKPVHTAFYRTRKSSNTHKLGSYAGDLLTAKHLNNLPIFEKIRLQGVLQSAWNFHGEYVGAIKKIHQLYDQLDLRKQEIERANHEINILRNSQLSYFYLKSLIIRIYQKSKRILKKYYDILKVYFKS